jgi:hypothetical protein
LEAAAVVGRDGPDVEGSAAVRELGGPGTPVIVADARGEVLATESA